MLLTKKEDRKEIDSATEESEGYTQEELEEQLQTELVVNGDSEEQVKKINEFIPDKDAEEIKETLEQEISQQQENVIDTALKDNAIELHNQETFEVSLNSNNLSSVQEAINSQLLVVFNEFLVDAQLGKYEYEKIIPMVTAYANNLLSDIKNSEQFSEEELTILSASITEKIIELNNNLYPYLGNSRVRTEEELNNAGIDTSSEHPYQEIIDATVENAQSTQESLQEEILEAGSGKVEIPEGATEYKPPEIHYYDENGNEADWFSSP